MCLIFTCGEHTFRKELQGYEGIICQCHNCGNYSGHVIKTNPWFTFCFVPVLPLSIHGYQDIVCHICNFAQPLDNRPDIKAMQNGGAGAAGGGGGDGNNVPMQNQPNPAMHGAGGPPQGWQGGGPPQQQPQGQQPMRYS